jgi:hypothetical protein
LDATRDDALKKAFDEAKASGGVEAAKQAARDAYAKIGGDTTGFQEKLDREAREKAAAAVKTEVEKVRKEGGDVGKAARTAFDTAFAADGGAGDKTVAFAKAGEDAIKKSFEGCTATTAAQKKACATAAAADFVNKGLGDANDFIAKKEKAAASGAAKALGDCATGAGAKLTGASKATCLGSALTAFENAGGKKEDFANAIVKGARDQSTSTYTSCFGDTTVDADEAARKTKCKTKAKEVAEKANPNFKEDDLAADLKKVSFEIRGMNPKGPLVTAVLCVCVRARGCCMGHIVNPTLVTLYVCAHLCVVWCTRTRVFQRHVVYATPPWSLSVCI